MFINKSTACTESGNNSTKVGNRLAVSVIGLQSRSKFLKLIVMFEIRRLHIRAKVGNRPTRILLL